MGNRILSLRLVDRLDDPAAAEVWVSAEPEETGHDIELRGRFMGPQCVYASTIEVAYPIRAVQGGQPSALASLGSVVARAFIPEPSLWEPDCPFLYQVRVELWQSGKLCDHRLLRHGLRYIDYAGHGLRVNGRPFVVRAVACALGDDEELLRLRAQGINTLVSSRTDFDALYERADRLGFFVLATGAATSRPEHPSFLGALLADDDVLATPLAPRNGAVEPPSAQFVAHAYPQKEQERPLTLKVVNDAPPADARGVVAPDGAAGWIWRSA